MGPRDLYYLFLFLLLSNLQTAFKCHFEVTMFLPWPLPERQAMVMAPPLMNVTDHLTEQT